MSEEKVKILIADDTQVNIHIIEKFLKPRGYDVISAEDGQIAIDKFKAEEPDIILMDVAMPNVDGYKATQAIKEASGSKWVPIVFLSAKVSTDDQIKGIEIGGDDYLTKPVNLNLLEIKLGAMIRILKMQRELNSTSAALQYYHDKAENELELAKKLMENMTQYSSGYYEMGIHVYSQAVDELNGDICLAYKSKDNDLYVLMADATGHGLAAAISLIPLSQTFFEMAEKGYTVSSIVRQLNSKLKKLLPPDRFVCATVALINNDKHFLEVWNGSNPIPMFFDNQGNLERVFKESNFALGIVSDDKFESKSEIYTWSNPGEFILCSDGLLDLKNVNKELFGYEGVKTGMALMGSKNRDNQIGFDILVSYSSNFSKNGYVGDDVSIMSVECK